MKIFLIQIILLFTVLSNAQEVNRLEEEIQNKADSYLDALEDLTIEGLSQEDKIYLKNKEEIIHTYCVEKAYYYLTELVNDYPNSKFYVSYLYKKGSMAEAMYSVNKLKNYDEAKRCFRKVIDINNSNYYSKLSLYYLATLYSNERNCDEAKKYINQLNQVQSDMINEFENWYITNGIKRINGLCP